MAAAPDNDMLRPPGPPPLGAILVRRGLLTEEQLGTALAESKRSGEPTGEVIVRLGFATAATIAQALATQHGRPLKTEYGYAVGFAAATPVTAASPPPVSPVPAQDERPAAPAPASAVRAAPPVEPVLAPAPLPAPPQLDRLQQLTDQRDAALADLEAARAVESDRQLALAAAREETASLRIEKDVLERSRAELERQLAELQASAAADDGHLAAATARVAELDGEHAKAREDATRFQMEKVALEAAHESMTARNEELERQLEEAERRVAQPEAHAEDPSHLLFVPTPEGYRLVEQDGPPPAPGSAVQLPDDDGTAVTLTVAKVGASPLPGMRIACAYLVAAA